MNEAQVIPSKPLLFQCPLCKEMGRLRDFRTSDHGLEIRCEECDGNIFYAPPENSSLPSTSAVTPAPPSKKSEPVVAKAQVPRKKVSPAVAREVVGKSVSSGATRGAKGEEKGESCPKCGHRNEPERKDCVRCGLNFQKARELNFQPLTHSNPDVAAQAQKLWAEVLENWEDLQNHERFLKYCAAYEMYQMAGRLYREQQELREGDWIAGQQIGKLVDVAHQQMLQQFQKDKSANEGVGSGVKWALVAFMALGGGLTIFLFMRYLQTMLKGLP